MGAVGGLAGVVALANCILVSSGIYGCRRHLITGAGRARSHPGCEASSQAATPRAGPNDPELEGAAAQVQPA